ncbi:hypothetical protein [Microcoleus sp. D2_18a_D3]|uniref:hypothetical protein n=1 Tax=Microcoleus sp. D2_18a_D3 TaxID=3055330 RepID=UPI002FD38035
MAKIRPQKPAYRNLSLSLSSLRFPLLIGAMERCYGHLKPRRWKGGGDGADLAVQALQQTEYSPAKKLQKED